MEKLLTNSQVAAYLATTVAGHAYTTNNFQTHLADMIYQWLESKEKDTK